ncbi:protein of unknown function [Epibacterium ulvae]|uniref:DUF3576 domain-containing protein n=1 Tax=Epibacterium ulvae TaxID=1156985 RepID=A0A1G5QX65_9RHOB|nr:DUF3576 domain-containing protein [Epibacterium ulvae]SCZ66352.1 protein of unknown function [Epibacterium ulvae]
MRVLVNIALIAAITVTTGCGAFGGRNNAAQTDERAAQRVAKRDAVEKARNERIDRRGRFDDDRALEGRETIFDLFNREATESSVQVNRYIWAAALDVLEFLPVQSVDPFTGVITTGFGTPPGGTQAYRATVHVRDPALDARSLNIALQNRNGRPVSAATARAVEDAILSRARQLRIADGKL